MRYDQLPEGQQPNGAGIERTGRTCDGSYRSVRQLNLRCESACERFALSG